VGKDSRDIIRELEADGWYFVGATGSHHHFKHPTKPGKVTLPHPRKDLHPKTLRSIYKQAGLKEWRRGMAGYIALVHKDEGTSYGVSFPDVPGCISAGDTLEEAVANAGEALAAHLALMRNDGDAVSPPRSFEELRRDPEFRADAADAIVTIVQQRLPADA
jgi:predicted RNA binding protein YcfA (HicA-like mRNA interferase family)/predicted RNase H-like HicB family nuclease